MKKKLFIVSFATFVSTTSLALIAANSNKTADLLNAEENELWYHYQAIEPTDSTHGSKEFWANCSTHNFSLTQPASDNIEEGVPFDTTVYFDELEMTDERYIPSISKQKSLGMLPVVKSGNITYGLYPQTRITDSSLISSLNAIKNTESNGWYLYEEEYYASVKATPAYSSMTFLDGTTITANKKYWFKCNPIQWKILYTGTNDYLLFSNVALDKQVYYNSTSTRTIGGKTIYPSNYQHSDVRTWLNNNFYNTAFSLNSSYVKTTAVNNSASQTDNENITYYCDNTNDKVFLLSYKELLNSSYGFGTSTSKNSARKRNNTDYSLARGAGPTSCLTRSPWGGHYNKIWYINGSNGSLNYGDATTSHNAVCPAIMLMKQ